MSDLAPILPNAPTAHRASLEALLRFEAPYVSEQLLARNYTTSLEEGRALLREAFRFLWLCHLHPDVHIHMFSVRVDEAWHQLALSTRAYAEFGRRFFGRFVHHAPSNAPPTGDHARREASFGEFAALYEAAFGGPLPEIWLDGVTVSLGRKMIVHDPAIPRVICPDGDRVALVETTPDGERLLLRVDRVAEPALDFVLSMRAFFVRELPALNDADKVALCQVLMRTRVLRTAR